ncbi:polysaccharide deacetylase family protein [Kitasatospora sp. NPDC048540]|uniref:polysaccharide deacetylase family protein n=1 Tax=Kitasatospora sp. NPDC048540 TaxID=3155634 RepID=UPI0033C96C5C
MTRRLLLVEAGFTLLSPQSWSRLSPVAGGTDRTADTTAGGAPAGPAPQAPSGSPPEAAAAPPVAAAAPQAAGPPAPVRVRDPLFSLSTDDRLIALTIDDGPDPTYTPAVLKLLAEQKISATFFLVGENAAAHPALVREIAAQGHHIANHTWTHPELRQLSDTKVGDELRRTSDFLHTTTGRAPTWFRAPGGDFTKSSLAAGAELGMRPMSWSVDPRDWSRPGTPAITSRVLEGVRPGAIVLNHDGGGDRSQTVAALRTYLPMLTGEGYRFTTPP